MIDDGKCRRDFRPNEKADQSRARWSAPKATGELPQIAKSHSRTHGAELKHGRGLRARTLIGHWLIRVIFLTAGLSD